MCSFITQHNVTDVTILRERVIGILTAGMSTRAVAHELNVNLSTISRLKGVSENLAVHQTGLTTATHV